MKVLTSPSERGAHLSNFGGPPNNLIGVCVCARLATKALTLGVFGVFGVSLEGVHAVTWTALGDVTWEALEAVEGLWRDFATGALEGVEGGTALEATEPTRRRRRGCIVK
jgi:hypothetical protein